jgi:hypothetical protein
MKSHRWKQMETHETQRVHANQPEPASLSAACDESAQLSASTLGGLSGAGLAVAERRSCPGKNNHPLANIADSPAGMLKEVPKT